MIRLDPIAQMAGCFLDYLSDEELLIIAAKLRMVTGGRKEVRAVAYALADELCPETRTQSGGMRIPESGRMKHATKGEGG